MFITPRLPVRTSKEKRGPRCQFIPRKRSIRATNLDLRETCPVGKGGGQEPQRISSAYRYELGARNKGESKCRHCLFRRKPRLGKYHIRGGAGARGPTHALLPLFFSAAGGRCMVAEPCLRAVGVSFRLLPAWSCVEFVAARTMTMRDQQRSPYSANHRYEYPRRLSRDLPVEPPRGWRMS